MASGHSGVRAACAEMVAAMLNADLVPWVPSRGSLGASGDLAPSAHLVLAMMGEGELLTEDGRREPSGPALQAAGLAPLVLEAKEGLSLLNGTQFMAAIGCLAVADGEALLDSADLIGAMSLEGLRASVGPFQERIQELRPIPGQMTTARQVRAATEGSAIMLSHLNCDKVQDAYSLRCIPQVHGACRDALRWLREVVAVEVDAVTDNPLVFPESGEIISAGNFHGEPLALALDLAAMAVSEIANISERRTFRMLTSSLSELPPFLTTDSGLNNGYMIVQYTAAALVVREQGAVPPRQRRLHPQLGGPGGPREHGHDLRAQAARRHAQRPGGAGHRGAVRGAGHRPAGAARGRRGDQGRARPREDLRAHPRPRPLPGAGAGGGGAGRGRRRVRRHRSPAVMRAA